MPSTVVVAVRQFLRDGLTTTFEGDPDVVVTYGWDPESSEQRQVFTVIPPRGLDQSPAALKAGRNHRNEQGEVQIVVHIEMPGDDQETADLQAMEYGQLVEEFVADNKSPAIPGVNWLVMSGVEYRGGLTGQSSVAQLIYSCSYDARLT